MTPSLLRRVHEQLSATGIAHALIGAAALAIHGVSRSTFDQDLLATDLRALTPAAWTALTDETHVDIRRGDDDDLLAGVVRVTCPGDVDGRSVEEHVVWDTLGLLRQLGVAS